MKPELETPPWRVLGALAIFAAVLRVVVAEDKSYFGDECGTLRWICESPGYLLTHFEKWLTMNWFLLLEKGIARVFGEGFLALRAVSILAGSATVLLVGVLATRWGFRRHAWIASAFVAVQPYLIKFSVTARSYALLAALGLAVWLQFLRWRREPTWRNANLFAALSMLTLLTHMNGAFVVIWVGAVLALELVRVLGDASERQRYLRALGRLAVPFLPLNGLAALYYFQLRGELREFRTSWADEGVTSLGYLPSAFETYFLDAGSAWVFFALMLVGFGVLLRRQPCAGVHVFLWIAIPVLGAAAAGYSHYPWAMARFHIFVVPVIVMLSAVGVGALAQRLGKHASGALVALVLGWWGWQDVGAYREEQLQRYHLVAEYISEDRAAGDRVLGYTYLEHLRVHSYLPCDERTSVRVASLSFVQEMLKSYDSRVFVVTYSEHRPAFDVESRRFGDIELSVFPAEERGARIRRLREGLEGLAAALAADHLCSDCSDLFSPLAELARLRGDTRAASAWRKKVKRSKALSDRARYRPGQ